MAATTAGVPAKARAMKDTGWSTKSESGPMRKAAMMSLPFMNSTTSRAEGTSSSEAIRSTAAASGSTQTCSKG